MVQPVQGDTPRVTISWNTFWKGKVGNINANGWDKQRFIDADVVDNDCNYPGPRTGYAVFK